MKFVGNWLITLPPWPHGISCDDSMLIGWGYLIRKHNRLRYDKLLPSFIMSGIYYIFVYSCNDKLIIELSFISTLIMSKNTCAGDHFF